MPAPRRLTRSQLARIRQTAGFTTCGPAALELFLSPGYLYELENGKATPGAGVIARMAALYGATEEAVGAAIEADRRDYLRRHLDNIGVAGESSADDAEATP